MNSKENAEMIVIYICLNFKFNVQTSLILANALINLQIVFVPISAVARDVIRKLASSVVTISDIHNACVIHTPPPQFFHLFSSSTAQLLDWPLAFLSSSSLSGGKVSSSKAFEDFRFNAAEKSYSRRRR